jgi:hypothetical protein
VLRVDGGMTASDWTMQFLADILGAPVDRPKVLETTALGAAWVAGSCWPGMDGFAASWNLDQQFTPAMDDTIRAEKLALAGAMRCPARSARANPGHAIHRQTHVEAHISRNILAPGFLLAWRLMRSILETRKTIFSMNRHHCGHTIWPACPIFFELTGTRNRTLAQIRAQTEQVFLRRNDHGTACIEQRRVLSPRIRPPSDASICVR